MFTVEQIELSHSKVKSGAQFPKYIQEIKEIGVTTFETWVTDSHTKYFCKNEFQTKSKPKYDWMTISKKSDINKFNQYLKMHKKGETDYVTFCKHCAETGIEKWIVDLDKMTCTYYDKAQNEILTENVQTA
jgi:uncharacterized protein YbcV (DUF1398 family)